MTLKRKECLWNSSEDRLQSDRLQSDQLQSDQLQNVTGSSKSACNRLSCILLLSNHHIAVTLWEIRWYQKTSELLIVKVLFFWLIRGILLNCNEISENLYQIQVSTLKTLQEAEEAYLMTEFSCESCVIEAVWRQCINEFLSDKPVHNSCQTCHTSAEGYATDLKDAEDNDRNEVLAMRIFYVFRYMRVSASFISSIIMISFVVDDHRQGRLSDNSSAGLNIITYAFCAVLSFSAASQPYFV